MSAPVAIRLTINGELHTIQSPPERPLLDVLREDLKLTGTKYGCGESQCGACSVLIDGKRTFSCRLPVSAAADKSVRTIEGLSARGTNTLHPVQQAFLDCAAFQCGYCTGGMIMTAVELLESNPAPDDAQIMQAMNDNLCRCCAYPNILAAIRQAVTLTTAKGERDRNREEAK